MSYMNTRFKKMKTDANPILMFMGMGIRLGLLLFIIISCRFFCNWAEDQSHNTVSEYNLNKYTRTKLKEIRDMKINGSISSEELKVKVNNVYRNTKQDYLKDKENNEK